MPYDKDKVAELVKSGRVSKGYTQSELAEKTRISLRSIQRIENGSVAPRLFTLKLLAEHLDFDPAPALVPESSPSEVRVIPVVKKTSGAARWIISIGSGLVILLGCAAFFSQSSHFPETNFETWCFLGVFTLIFTFLLWRIWK